MTIHQHAATPIGHTEEIEETEFFSCCNNGFEEIRMGLTYDGAVYLSWSETDYQLHSGVSPSILENLLFLPGSDRRLDNNVAKYIYLSPKRALEAKEAFEKIIAEINEVINGFKQYRKTGLQLMRPYIPGEDLSKVSVNPVDTPEEGGMIARNTSNYEDQWYVSKKFFEENYEAVE